MSNSVSSSSAPYRNTHRYLDVLTVRPTQGARPSSSSAFSRPPTTLSAKSFATASELGGGPASSSGSHRGHGLHSSTHIHGHAHSLSSTIHPIINNPTNNNTSHSHLLIEPILLPNLQHVHVDNPQDLEESCLFYPNGHKNRNIRREIESAVVKHHIMENNRIKASKKTKDKYRVVRVDPYADVKGAPLVLQRTLDPTTKEIMTRMRHTEGRIVGLTQIRL